MNFNQDGELNVDEVVRALSFPFHRERFFTSNNVDTGKEAVIRDDLNVVLGVVSANSATLPYYEVMDYFRKNADELGLPIHLVENHIIGDGKAVSQRWIVDGMSFKGPDGTDLYPFFKFFSSYQGGSTKIDFGVWRQICSNGAMASKSIKSISIRPTADYLRKSISEEIKIGMSKFVRVEERYKKMAQVSMREKYESLMKDENISFAFKKQTIDYLISDQVVGSIAPFTKTDLLVHHEDFVPLIKEKDEWYFYNVTTAVSSHQSHTISSRDYTDKVISNLFVV